MKKGMTFTEYVQMSMNKAYNREDVQEHPVLNKIAGPIDVNKQLNPSVWNAKIIGDEKYLFFSNHWLNVTKLHTAIQKTYEENGYSGYGFGKLDESELVRYKTLRDILMNEFLTSLDDELNPEEVAKVIFDNEPKDFEWQLEPIVSR